MPISIDCRHCFAGLCSHPAIRDRTDSGSCILASQDPRVGSCLLQAPYPKPAAPTGPRNVLTRDTPA